MCYFRALQVNYLKKELSFFGFGARLLGAFFPPVFRKLGVSPIFRVDAVLLDLRSAQDFRVPPGELDLFRTRFDPTAAPAVTAVFRLRTLPNSLNPPLF